VRAEIAKIISRVIRRGTRAAGTVPGRDSGGVRAKDFTERTPYQWQMYHKAKPQLTFSDKEIAALLKGPEKQRLRICRRSWRSSTV
jgi:hypothetical protein